MVAVASVSRGVVTWRGFSVWCVTQIRNQGGERDTTYSGVFDVSNRHRLGYSEVQLVQTMLDGLEKLIALEKKLEAGETVTL